MFKSYGITQIVGDRFGGNFVTDAFQRAGIRYLAADRDRSRFYLDLVPLVNAQQAVLLDHPLLLKELRGLERRRLASGKDRVDHRASGGAHDDAANSAAIALVTAVRPQFQPHMMRIVGF